MKPKRIILVRHGESEGNADREMYETTPDYKLNLTSLRRNQAVEAGNTIKSIIGNESVYAYVSPYYRTRQTYAEIKNNLVGMYFDSLAECKIANTKIYNNSLYGVYASSANLQLTNCLFYNQGQSSVNIETGGDYEINYCSLVNFGNTEPALFLSNARCIDFPFCETVYKYPLHAKIQNCVITGSDQDELWMVVNDNIEFKPFFKNCTFRIDELSKVFPGFSTMYTDACEIYPVFDRLFKDISSNDFHLDTLSFLENKALIIPGIDKDLDGVIRDVDHPDIGCYEFVPR